MNIGMLWFDNDKDADLNTKVARAAQYYQEKYGRRPNLCFVNPATGEPCQAGDVEVRTTECMQANHFWIGVNNPKVLSLDGSDHEMS